MKCVDVDRMYRVYRLTWFWQVCNLEWSKNCNEIVSTYGYSQNQIINWSYPQMTQVTVYNHIYNSIFLFLFFWFSIKIITKSAYCMIMKYSTLALPAEPQRCVFLCGKAAFTKAVATQLQQKNAHMNTFEYQYYFNMSFWWWYNDERNPRSRH